MSSSVKRYWVKRGSHLRDRPDSEGLGKGVRRSPKASGKGQHLLEKHDPHAAAAAGFQRTEGAHTQVIHFQGSRPLLVIRESPPMGDRRAFQSRQYGMQVLPSTEDRHEVNDDRIFLHSRALTPWRVYRRLVMRAALVSTAISREVLSL